MRLHHSARGLRPAPESRKLRAVAQSPSPTPGHSALNVGAIRRAALRIERTPAAVHRRVPHSHLPRPCADLREVRGEDWATPASISGSRWACPKHPGTCRRCGAYRPPRPSTMNTADTSAVYCPAGTWPRCNSRQCGETAVPVVRGAGGRQPARSTTNRNRQAIRNTRVTRNLPDFRPFAGRHGAWGPPCAARSRPIVSLIHGSTRRGRMRGDSRAESRHSKTGARVMEGLTISRPLSGRWNVSGCHGRCIREDLIGIGQGGAGHGRAQIIQEYPAGKRVAVVNDEAAVRDEHFIGRETHPKMVPRSMPVLPSDGAALTLRRAGSRAGLPYPHALTAMPRYAITIFPL